MKHEFILNFDRKAYEEMYDLENQGSYLKSPSTKKSFNFLIAACAFFVLGVINLFINRRGIISMLLPVGFLIGTLVSFLLKANSLRIWNKEIQDYLDRLEGFQSHKIVLSENTFTVIQDSEEVIERWSNFRKIIVHKNHIELIGHKNYRIPKKAIKESDYSKFKEVITQSLAK
jgi:hypothetical protein